VFIDRIVTLRLQIFILTGLLAAPVSAYAQNHDGKKYYASRESYEDYSQKRYKYIRGEYSGNTNTKKNIKVKKTVSPSSTTTVYVRYKVKKGDTLYSIAGKYGLSTDALKKANNMKSGNHIAAGSTLRIPVKKEVSAGTGRKAPAKTIPAATRGSSPSFKWPLAHVVRYDRDGMEGVKSIGLVIRGKNGAPVMSSAAGTVEKIGYMRGYGRYIVLKHNNNFITVYANLENITVREGDRISSGKTLGYVDRDTGKIHFQIDYDGKTADPLRYLPRKTG
jgi:murein DD-endopeptidase MepM/ murein hydrolase activator NlpD